MPSINTGNVVVYGENHYYEENYKTGEEVSNQIYRPVSKIYSVQRNSIVSPGYPKVLGQNPFTYIEKTEIRPQGSRSTVTLGAINRVFRSGSFDYSDGRTAITLQPAYSSTEKNRLDAELRTEIRLKMKDQKVNFAVAAAEWQRTSDMVASTATKIYNTYRDLRRGDFVGAANRMGIKVPKRSRRRFQRSYARNQSDAVARGWLELQYGWKPLLSDVHGAAEFAAKQVVPAVRSRVSRKKSLEKTSQVNVISGTAGSRQTMETKTSKLDIKYVVFFTMNASLAPNAASAGLLNPAVVAWELVPFSFVVDWFLPIGDVLNSLDATAGLGFNGGCVTTFERLEAVKISNVSGVNTKENTTWSLSSVNCNRMKLSTFPNVAQPYFKNPVSVTHALNAIALLQTLRK